MLQWHGMRYNDPMTIVCPRTASQLGMAANVQLLLSQEGVGESIFVILYPTRSLRISINVDKTMSCLPSPSHHHKYIGGIPTTTEWVVYDIVLTSLCTSNFTGLNGRKVCSVLVHLRDRWGSLHPMPWS